MGTDLSKRQVEILEASGRLLMAKGILGLTTKNLAHEMKFSESALYRHFKDKETIISQLIIYLSDDISTRFENILATEETAYIKLLTLFKSQLKFFKANPHFITIVLSDVLLDSSESIKKEIKKLMQTNNSSFQKIIIEGQEQKIFRNDVEADYLVHVVMGSFRLQMLKWKLADFTFNIDKVGMKTMENALTLIKN